MKACIASILTEERRRELFENYASIHEKQKFGKESFDEFVDQLMDEVTLVCVSLLLRFALPVELSSYLFSYF